MPEVKPPIEPAPVSELRRIIVNATSEMLDNPGEHGIYQTGKFYDRLEAEITEYIQENPKPNNIYTLMLETVKNSPHVEPTMQNAVAQFVSYQATPVRIVRPVKVQG